MAEGVRDEVRYTAFLSYSHKDAAAAGKLHRRLESYRLPRRLVGKETPRGIVPARLWPIFRDRDELPAASDLSETVRTALARSGALIILCSAHAAESLWVAEEIRVFRELHPDRPILAAILDGDPPGCFPQALRAFGQDGTWHEPLATDLRREADGPHLGLLKLVAGITGVGLDELVQRDAARRIRRVMAVTGAALAAMLIMAALAVVALNARAEAERQRAEAEGLVEFMLTDLRERLKGSVGQLDIMTAVNQRALQYYGGQRELNGLNPLSLERRARVLQAIGEDDVRRGNLARALTAFEEAHRTTAEALARAPADPRRIFAHGQSEFWVGNVHYQRREWAAAREYFNRYAQAAERLVSIAPEEPDYLMEMGYGATNIGNVQLNGDRDPVAAQASYEKAVLWFGRAADARPSDVASRRQQANAYAWLADSFSVRRLWRQSLDARLKQYRIVERLRAADPANIEMTYRFALSQRALALAYRRVGNRGNARPLLLQAYDWSVRLTGQDPRNAEWLLFKTLVECDLVFAGLGTPERVSRYRLERNIRASAAALRAQHNPRVSEFSSCLSQLG
jgi:hypothetical protein